MVLSLPGTRRLADAPCAAVGAGDGATPGQRGAAAQAERLEVRQREGHPTRASDVAERVAAGVAVGVGVVRRADAEAVEHDDRGAPHHGPRRGLHEAEAERGERLIEQLLLVRVELARGLLWPACPSVSIRVCATWRASPQSLGARAAASPRGRLRLMGEPEHERREMRIHPSLR